MACNTCPNKICLKTGSPCRNVENYLERENARNGYSLRHIRRKEIPYANKDMDFVVSLWVNRIYGRQKKIKYFDENDV